MASGKVLLIEDDEESVLLISQLLVRIGYTKNNIVIGRSLAEVNNLGEDDFEVILSDLTLPDSTHDRTFERVYANFSHIPIIVLTGEEEHDFAARTIQQGAQDFLVKGSFGVELLQRAIRYAIERNKIHHELEKSRADYRRVFDESPNPMFVFDRNTYKVLEANIAAIRQYGYSKDELLQLSVENIRPEEDKQPFRDMIRTVTDKYIDAGTWRHIYKDGTVKYVQIYSHKTKFNDIDAIVSMAINVDEKVRVKERLKERNKEITDILDSISDGFFTVSKDWVITYVNAAFEKMLNRSREEVVDTSIWDSFPGLQNSIFYESLIAGMEEKKVIHNSGFSHTANKWLSVNIYPIRDGLAVYFLNITEEHALQEQLVKNDKTLRAIINNTSDIIWSIDRDLNILEANQPFWDKLKQQTGKTEQELERGDFNKILFATWEQYFERAFKGEAYKTIWEEDSAAGKQFQEVSFNPIHDNANNVIGISCFSRDITAQRNYQLMIEQQNKQLKEIAWLQSHKVRSHVATILGLSQFVNTQIITDPDLNDVLTGIQDAAQELDTVIREINVLTKNVND